MSHDSIGIDLSGFGLILSLLKITFAEVVGTDRVWALEVVLLVIRIIEWMVMFIRPTAPKTAVRMNVFAAQGQWWGTHNWFLKYL